MRVTANGRLCGVLVGTGGAWRGAQRLIASYRGNEIVAASRNGDDVAIAALAVTEGAAQSAHLNLEICFFDVRFGPGRAISSSLPTTSPACSTRAARMSKARLPWHRPVAFEQGAAALQGAGTSQTRSRVHPGGRVPASPFYLPIFP